MLKVLTRHMKKKMTTLSCTLCTVNKNNNVFLLSHRWPHGGLTGV